MSNLPNSDQDRIKVYPNEYITNSTINRPNLRLLQNDLYLEQLWTDAISGLLHIAGLINHNDLTNVTTDQHHPQHHTIVSHDTTATGADLTQLTDGSNADTLHTHSAAANHGVTHIDGTDQIPTATSTTYGIMSPSLYNQLNDAVLKSTDQTINSDKTINGDVTINGTFRATSAVFVETEHIGLSANYINLNTNETGTPSQDAGVSVIRGTSNNSVLNWNETTDRWEAGICGSLQNIVLSSDLPISNNDINYLSGAIDDNTHRLSGYIPLSGSDQIAGSLIPNNNNVDLGSSVHPFRTLYVSGSTIHVGNQNISESDVINWNELSGDINYLSGAIDNNSTDISSISSDIVSLNSDNWDSVYSTVSANSGSWGTGSSSGSITGYTDSDITAISSDVSGNTDDISNLQIGQMDFFIPGNYNSSVLTGILTNIGHNYCVWRQSPAHITNLYATHYSVDSTAQPSIALTVNGSAQTAIQLSGQGNWVPQTLNVAISAGQTLNINVTSLNSGAGDAEDLTVSLKYTID